MLQGYIDKDSGTFEIDLTKFDEEVDSASSGISDSSEVDLNSTNPSSNLTIDDAGSSSESFIAQNHYFVRVKLAGIFFTSQFERFNFNKSVFAFNRFSVFCINFNQNVRT